MNSKLRIVVVVAAMIQQQAASMIATCLSCGETKTNIRLIVYIYIYL